MNGLKDPEINVFDTVVDLRFDRPGMVQTSVIAFVPPSPFFCNSKSELSKNRNNIFSVIWPFWKS